MLFKFLILFVFLVSVGGCSLKSVCALCTSLPDCKHIEFYSGLNICIPVEGQVPEEEMVLRTSIWPSECKYVEKEEKIISDSTNEQQQHNNNNDASPRTPLYNDTISSFEIVLGILSLLSFIFGVVDLYLRCKKLRRESEERNGYTRFYNHNNSIDSFPLQV